jgi:hypothetical protein
MTVAKPMSLVERFSPAATARPTGYRPACRPAATLTS